MATTKETGVSFCNIEKDKHWKEETKVRLQALLVQKLLAVDKGCKHEAIHCFCCN